MVTNNYEPLHERIDERIRIKYNDINNIFYVFLPILTYNIVMIIGAISI
jgi:hypothetical protein